ncbi:MAG: glycosyltransferase family 4 protein [Planctomycetota bacterium]
MLSAASTSQLLNAAASDGAVRPRVVWEGSPFVHHSLSLVNREIGRRLIEFPIELSWRPFEPDSFDASTRPELQALSARINAELSGSPQVEIRHRWPPRLDPVAQGKLVVIQPWEFGSLPRTWVEPMRDNVDEIWVPTHYVRDIYLEAGLAESKVVVIPNGVDTQRFDPNVEPMSLPTQKRFRFLFVGGTIARKGISGLLEAYCRTFTRLDDVVLVIKDLGGQGVYRGQTARDLIRSIHADPHAPEILHFDAEIPDADLPSLYAAADAFVHPYLGEGFGLPIAEAMAMQRPIIVTGLGAALDFCDEGCAWLVPAERQYLSQSRVGDLETVGRPWLARPDLTILGDHMRHVFDGGPDIDIRTRAARLRILSGFTWDLVASKVYERLLQLS